MTSCCTGNLCICLPCCRERKRYQQKRERTVHMHLPHGPTPQVHIHQPQDKFPSNEWISSKYTIWNFIPKNLFEQFRRIANFYFLTVGFIQLLIDTPVSPATSIIPLVFVVTVTAIKQGYEDYLRHKADKEVNNAVIKKLVNGRIEEDKAMNIKVGDIIKVEMNEIFQCDLVMLSSANDEGQCYVTTANLDGETNLKTFTCLPDTKEFRTEESFKSLRAYIQCEQPQPDIYRFNGNLVLNDGEGTKPLSAENILLRGACLKTTPFVYGCAVYTGPDTKMALNGKPKATKFSRVERRLNTYLLVFLMVLLVMSLVSTLLMYWKLHQPNGKPWYIPSAEKDASLNAKKIVENFLAFMVLYNYLIPISMYVTIEIQKIAGFLFFCWDLEMYDEEMNQPALANTSDLNEELGQVEYLFTDKTGTLTENIMEFRECSVRGVGYIEEKGELKKLPGHTPTTSLQGVEDLLEVLVLCHTVRIEHQNSMEHVSEDGSEYKYTASSPDEKAFVEACRRLGVVYHGIYDDIHHVSFQGQERKYKLLQTLEFDSTRKRMSVIVENSQGKKLMLVKGAESNVFDRVMNKDSNTFIATEKAVTAFASKGLRTLVIARKHLSDTDYSKIDQDLNNAKLSIHDRERLLADVYDKVESDLELIGATAVEDKLQADVPKTIKQLREAGIKVWVLTGDKEETALSVSYEAELFTKEFMKELRITRQQSSVECAETLAQLNQQIFQDANECSDSRNRGSSRKQWGLIVDGISMAHILQEHGNMFRELCKHCCSVLCCRLSPLQKAEVVKLIKTSEFSPVTAAIGDGANDVSMIKEAHVGLGIYGKEGRQAVSNSDYAFGKFKYVGRALLVHGHYFYMRISNLIQYFFYKNVAFIIAQFFFMFFSAYSQQPLFDTFQLMFYNITFTSLPILIYGFNEKDLPESLLMKDPSIYRENSRNNNMKYSKFLQWNILGLWHVTVFFFGVYFIYGEDMTLFKSGENMGIFSFGTIILHVCVIAVNLKLALLMYTWNSLTFFGFAFSTVGNISMTLMYSLVWWNSFQDVQPFYYLWTKTLSSPVTWLSILLLCIIALLPDAFMRVVTDIRRTLKIHHIQSRISGSFLTPLLVKQATRGTNDEGKTELPGEWTPDRDSPVVKIKNYQSVSMKNSD